VAGVIHAAWAEVLAADAVEPGTHFFDFGGHSVTAMRMMTKVRRELNVSLPTRLIFDHPVLGEFTEAAVKHLDDVPNQPG
jgi:acyl carrier protein